MKSEERHRLKQNVLAEALGDMPTFIKDHGPRIGAYILVAVTVVVGINFLRGFLSSQKQQQFTDLVDTIQSAKVAQFTAAQTSQSGAIPEADAILVNAPTFQRKLDELAKAGKAVSLFARLEKAELLRSQLYYSTRQWDDQERDSLLSQVETIYRQLMQDGADNPVIAGMAQLGLGLVAEDRRDWDQAKEIYQSMAASPDKWQGTLYPFYARNRLENLSEWTSAIAFGSVGTPVAETAETGKADLPDELFPDWLQDEDTL